MADQRPALSLTLPPNFYSPSHGDMGPRTPERPIARDQDSMPGAQTTQARFRLRRRPAGRHLSSQLFAPPPAIHYDYDTPEMPIPSIEVAGEDQIITTADSSPIRHQADGFLSPLAMHFSSEIPTTPAAQTVSFDGNNWSTARQRELGESITRPMSQSSNWSNSSDESDSLSTVASSYGTSCTSPDRAANDPFLTPCKDEKFSFSQSLIEAGRIPELGASRPKVKTRWTSAMDDHLWTAYQLYLQDPTVTPIKTLPGNAPPLGVCHRVARQAKQTWKEPRLRSSAARFCTPQPVGSPKVDIAHDNAASDMEAPERRAKAAATWPKLGATRRRLRDLAKNRATIAPHYMRLIAGRSASPFSSSSAQSVNSRRGSNAPLAGDVRAQRQASRRPDGMEAREVRLALATATSETMQPNGPLAQLQRDTPGATPEPMHAAPSITFSFNEPTVPFASPAPVPSSVANRRSSVDLLMPDAPIDPPPRLGSPFVPTHSHTWTAPSRRQHARAGVARGTFEALHSTAEEPTQRHLPRPSTSTGPRSLRSPIHFQNSFPYNRSVGSKRRAEHSLEDVSSPRHISHRRPGLNVDELFGPPLQTHAPSRDGARSPVEQRRVRLRGFSLGDAIMQSQQYRQDAADTLSNGDDPFVENAAASGALSALNPNATASRALGSPFRASNGSASRPRRFKVRHLPHNSLDSYHDNLIGSIGERLEGGQ